MPTPRGRGILVFPEWVGVGEYTQKRAQMLGDLGFNAFVVDVYGKGIRPNTPETCQTEMMKYATNRLLLRERARWGLDQLRKVPNTDTSKIALMLELRHFSEKELVDLTAAVVR
jgi:dienelactone hydrolase